MTILRIPGHSNMNRSRGPGWAAFGHPQHQKQGSGSDCDVDPYPSISSKTTLGHTKSSTTNHAPVKSFSSVVGPSVEFPLLVRSQNTNSVAKPQDGHITVGPDVTLVKMLKDIHIWADENLIEDILAAVNNDVDQASVLLKAMVSPQSKLEEGVPLGPSSTTASEPCENNKYTEKLYFSEGKLSDEDSEVEMSKRFFSVPSEPEWEEDDIYINQRKDAIKMMRTAAQHSRAAGNAFLRGDHRSAQEYSSQAREEWMEAEKLNAKAAEEILRIRNNDSDLSKIDLHGLHASEAVRALKEHLHKIESRIVMKSASFDESDKLETGISRSSSCEGVSGLVMNESKKKEELPQHRQTLLHVITGKGNHSRGQAALPTAIRSFLIENGYRFDDARAGVITVRPKFRQKRS